MADGGEGTSETILAAVPGEWCPCRVMGPLPGQEVEAGQRLADQVFSLVEVMG